MSPSSQDPELHIKLARLQSGIENPPTDYLQALESFRGLYPFDVNFHISFQPKTGYGVITCLEEGCQDEDIKLTRRSGAVSGKDEGFGSLESFKRHLSVHKTHKHVRRARTKDQGHDALLTRPKIMAVVPSPTHPSPVKRPASTILKKRNSEVFFVEDKSIEASSFPPAKRMKVIEEPSTPVRHSGLGKSPKAIAGPRRSLGHKPSTLSVAAKHAEAMKREIAEAPNVPAAFHNPSFPSLNSLNNGGSGAGRSVVGGIPPSRTVSRAKVKPEAVEHKFNFNVKAEGVEMKPSPKFSPHPFPMKARRLLFDLEISDHEDIKPRVKKDDAMEDVKFQPKLDDNEDVEMGASSDVDRDNGASSDAENEMPGHYGDYDYENEGINPAVQAAMDAAMPNIAAMHDGADENGDFHGRGRDGYQGPVAEAGDLHNWILAAGNAEDFEGNVTVDDAVKALDLDSATDLVSSTVNGKTVTLNVVLLAYQIIGVAWMRNQEESRLGGGTLADDMGLGKSVQTLALIIKNRSKKPKLKSTLIVAPTALLDQWAGEIESKVVDSKLSVYIYHGAAKTRMRKESELLSYDVVITSYGTVSSEWYDAEGEAKKEARVAKQKKASVNQDFVVSDSDTEFAKPKAKKTKNKTKGLLLQVQWFRIVLDEAQNIRNRATKTSKAANELMGVHRWCLTGTPIINALADAYGIIRFLKIRPWYEWASFNDHIARLEKKQPAVATSRLQKIFKGYQLRRMKTSQLDGKNLIELGVKKVETRRLEFSEEELEIYKAVESRTQARFNRYLRAGTVLKNYVQVLVLLLRLRQCCSHPCLIQEGEGTFLLAPREVNMKAEHYAAVQRARENISEEWVESLKEKLLQEFKERIANEKESDDAAVEVDECPICMDHLSNATITKCGHTFCATCIQAVLDAPRPEDAGTAGGRVSERPCPSCRSGITPDLIFPRIAFEPTDAELGVEEDEDDIKDEDDGFIDDEVADSDEEYKPGQASSRPKRKAASRAIVIDSEDEAAVDDGSDMDEFIVEDDSDYEREKRKRIASKPKAAPSKKSLGKRRAMVIESSDEDEQVEDPSVIFGKKKPEEKKMTKKEIKMPPRFLPSTKMKAMMSELEKTLEEHPDEKTIVVSQWTSCLELVSAYLQEKGFVHVKYQGSMSRRMRDASVRTFMNNEKTKVMLMSLKCGGVGLNLVRANRVISLDLGWSPAIESQAFDRVHRLGQTRDVFVDRLVIEGTVEERIMALQERKQGLADGSLGEGSGQKLGKLTVKDLRNLFGMA